MSFNNTGANAWRNMAAPGEVSVIRRRGRGRSRWAVVAAGFLRALQEPAHGAAAACGQKPVRIVSLGRNMSIERLTPSAPVFHSKAPGLVAAGGQVLGVPQKLMAHARDAVRNHDAVRNRGESDRIDALVVAGAALREPDPAAEIHGRSTS